MIVVHGKKIAAQKKKKKHRYLAAIWSHIVRNRIVMQELKTRRGRNHSWCQIIELQLAIKMSFVALAWDMSCIYKYSWPRYNEVGTCRSLLCYIEMSPQRSLMVDMHKHFKVPALMCDVIFLPRLTKVSLVALPAKRQVETQPKNACSQLISSFFFFFL